MAFEYLKSKIEIFKFFIIAIKMFYTVFLYRLFFISIDLIVYFFLYQMGRIEKTPPPPPPQKRVVEMHLTTDDISREFFKHPVEEDTPKRVKTPEFTENMGEWLKTHIATVNKNHKKAMKPKPKIVEPIPMYLDLDSDFDDSDYAKVIVERDGVCRCGKCGQKKEEDGANPNKKNCESSRATSGNIGRIQKMRN